MVGRQSHYGDGRVDPALWRHRRPSGVRRGALDVFSTWCALRLGGRHVCESYSRTPVNYHASRPLTLVVLRDRGQSMHPSTYANN